MAKIAAYQVTDFGGGVRRDKSMFELQKNELLDARNVQTDNRGRLRVRLGSQQLGNTLSGTIENSFVYRRISVGAISKSKLLVNNSASTSVISELGGSYLTVALTTSDTTLTMNDTAPFANSGTVEIEGDLISYTSKPGSGVLAGVTGVTSNHAINSAVHQWTTLTQSGTAVNGLRGVTYAVLNNILFFTGGIGNMKQYDASTVTDVSSEPSVLSLTNYRDRLYGIGDGSSSTSGDPRRISFSARGDGTSWTTGTDYFDVEDQQGESLRALKVHNDRLGIFKDNSIYTYDEVELKQRIPGIGAYNQKVVKVLNDKVFTFCQAGIFITNLHSARPIGEPVREFWENFIPVYDATFESTCTNTCAWVTKTSYFLYLGDVTIPTTTNDVVLEYNTLSDSWAVHDGGYTDFAHTLTVDGFPFGEIGSSGGISTKRQAYFSGDANGKVWRLNENIYRLGTSTTIGGNLYVDRRSDTGTPIPAKIETPLYDLTYPYLFKKFKNLRLLAERGQWQVEYRVENEKLGITAYRPMGSITRPNQVLPFPGEAQGFRVGFRFHSVNTSASSIFNGFVIEDTEVTNRS